jgi:hypothetical protein
LLQELQQKTQDAGFVEWFAWNSGWNYYILIYTTVRHHDYELIASYHCYSWWTWWSDTLWATLIRLWLHLSCYHQTVVVENFSAIAIDACCVTWGLACSTRSGVPRISQTYSSYPAGTDILFDATEVHFHHLLSL